MSARPGNHHRPGRALDEAVARLALLALTERDVQRLLDRAVVSVVQALDVEHVQIFELLPDGRTLVSRASANGERRAQARVRADRPAASQASYTLTAGLPVLSEDLATEARFRPSRSQRAHGVVTSASVPLYGRRGRPYGVVEVGASRPLAVSTDDAVDFLQSVGHLLVPAIERARLEAACRFLAESESWIVSAQGFRESVSILAETAVPRLADWCCIDVVLPAGDIECVALTHSDPAVSAAAGKLRSRLRPDPDADVGIAHVVRTGVPEFHFDLGQALSLRPAHEKSLARLVELAGFRSAIVTPLAARGHVFGAVTLVARSPRRLFDEGDVMLADAFATHAGLALDNVRLFFGRGREVPSLPRLAGATSGIVLLDSEILASRLLSLVAAERDRLARIVDTVVLASRLGLAEELPAAGTCDAVEETRAALDLVRSSLPANVTLELEQPVLLAAGDAETVRRIVTSLVENAAAYSPEGGRITVRIEARDGVLRLEIADDGIGIDPDERELVFEKFRRGTAAQAVADGIGLGLYVCRELAHRLNGRIEILDRSPGTTVVAELPLAASAARHRTELARDEHVEAAISRTSL